MVQAMTKTTKLEKIATCTKCGRDFLTLPANHMIDMYKNKNTGDDLCGGALREIKHEL